MAKNRLKTTIMDDNTDVNKQYFGADEIQISSSFKGATNSDNQIAVLKKQNTRSMLELPSNATVPRVNMVLTSNSRVTPNQMANNSLNSSEHKRTLTNKMVE